MSASEVKEIIANLGDISKDVNGKTVLVTGGAGFLGSWLCDVLVELNANVICMDNLASGLESNISDLLTKDNFAFIKHDITQPIFFDEDLDVVLHLASRASPFEFQRLPDPNPEGKHAGNLGCTGYCEESQGATSLHFYVRDIRKRNGGSNVRRVHRKCEPDRSEKLL